MPALGADEEEAGMIPRSLLFAPADSERKMEKASASGADLVILDLEDSVSAAQKPIAREMANAFLKANPDRSKRQLWVRINPIDTPMGLEDLAGVVGIALIVGIFTRFSAIMSVVMALALVFAGATSTLPQLLTLGLIVSIAGANAGYYGLDYIARPIEHLFAERTKTRLSHAPHPA